MVADERYFMIYCIVYRYLCTSKIEINGSLKFEITAKRLYAASQRVL